MEWFGGFCRDDIGATAIEYALIASLVFLVIIAAVTALSQKVENLYQTISDAYPTS